MIQLIQTTECSRFPWMPFSIRSGFSLSGCCFGTGIIQNCTKWSNMGVHGLSYEPFVAKLRCTSFLLRKNQEQWQYGPTKHKNVDREKKSLRSYMPHTKVGKNKPSDKIHSNLINLIIYNHFWLTFIKIHVS